MKTLNFALLAVFVATVLSGCFKPDKTVYNDLETMLEKSVENVEFVKAESLYEMLEAAAGPMTVVDVREPNEFEAGHIPGAINIPRGTLEFSNLLSNRRQTVVLYSNANQRSALSANNLKLLKYGDVKVLEGGFGNWQEVFPERVEEGPGSLQGGGQAKQVTSGGCGD